MESQYTDYLVNGIDFVVDTVQVNSTLGEKSNSWIMPMHVYDDEIPMKLDTGSDVNIIPESD